MLSRRSSQSGLGFGPFFFTLLFLVMGWLATYYAIGYFGKAKAQTIMVETILLNRAVTEEEPFKAAIIEDLLKKGPIVVKPEDVTVLRGEKLVKVSIKFTQRAAVPLTDYGVDLPFEASVEEKTDVQRAF